MRFYDIQEGQIMVDGRNLQDLDIYTFRRHVGLVLQDVFLFTGTIYDNITLYDTQITRARVEEAARAIGAHAFISRLPGGYDFNVRERGAVLSLGQRQIISFLRALVRQPSILILDEATSSIDTESEMVIQKAIDILMKDRTSIVIAHRLSTIQNCNNIIILDKGRIAEQGNHKTLMDLNGQYRKLYEAANKTRQRHHHETMLPVQ
jgi:ATP-binding cassette subfamily B protein